MPNLPAHSPLGASGAARWLKCRGSVGMAEGIYDPESEFAALGTAAHVLLEHCLNNEIQAWTEIGKVVGIDLEGEDILVDQDMSVAVQTMIDAIHEAHPDTDQGNAWVERKFHCPDIHPLFYGTADYVHWDRPNRHLHVWDYKHGAGIVVEAPWNVQTMYYACGALEDLALWNEVDTVTIHIGQPRGWHYDGPIRQWTLSTDDLDEWLFTALVPGMERALEENETVAGDHCRFCPVRLRNCPALEEKTNRLKELLTMAEKQGGIEKMEDAELGELIALETLCKIKFKAARDVAFGRMSAGKKIPGAKLVKAKANRVWRKGAEAAAKKLFGGKAMTKPELKSPSQIEKMAKGDAFAEEWGFKPDTGLQLVPADDRRREVSRDTKAGFDAGPKKFVKS